MITTAWLRHCLLLPAGRPTQVSACFPGSPQAPASVAANLKAHSDVSPQNDSRVAGVVATDVQADRHAMGAHRSSS